MSSKRLQKSLLASLVLHLFIFLVLQMDFSTPATEEAPIEISFIEEPEKLQEQPPKSDDARQIVDQSERALNDEVPEDAHYLSRHNQKVVKETKAREKGQFKNQTGGGQERDPGRQTQAGAQAKKPKVVPQRKGLPSIEDLTPKFDWDRVGSMGSKGSDSGHAQTDDYLKDVDDGLQTMLNTREFVYYSYYSRIKDRLQQYWEPKIKEKVVRMLREGRSIASSPTDRVTQVVIVLDEKGILKRVQIIGESGIRDLDEAAVEAFRAAAPFPNPPKGIVEKDGTVKIRWDFVLEA